MRLPRISRALVFSAAAFLLGIPAQAYYHYTYYLNGNRTTPVHARFTVGNTSAGATVTFIVNDAGPSNYGSGDSFGSVLAEVKQAIAAWGQVSSSQLKLAFGGIEQYPQNENAPGVDITFNDLPPGLLGYASPNLPAKPTTQTDFNGQFVPVTRSTVVLTNDTSQDPGPTYREYFFTTAVHEIGHALGLQHTWTGAAMTPQVAGRNTNRARPIDADDIAALSVLYGAPNWTSQYGAISGRVTFTTGAAVSMASVVAIPVNGPAVSTLTNPDGSYTINGLPTANSYLVYAHPLPPDAVPSNSEGLTLPEDQNGAQTFQPSGAFQTIFYPSTLTPPVNNMIGVQPGSTVSNINFSVRQQSSVALYDVQTWGYIDPGTHNYTAAPPNTFINPSPGFANSTQGQLLIAASANSVNMPSSLQSVTLLGGFASAAPLPSSRCVASLNSPCFSTSGQWMFAIFTPPPFPGTGVRHMVFNMGNDIFVLPNAVTLVQAQPPMVNSVNTNGDGTVTVNGSGFAPDTVIYFDGLAVPGTYNSNTSITVTPPPANSGQNSLITAYNSDGQNSTFLQFGGSPLGSAPTYSFGTSSNPTISVNSPFPVTTTGPDGFSTMIAISGTNTNFVNGQTTVGFGTSDITVSRVWVQDPTHLLANIMVAPNAAIGSSEVSVISGFQVASLPFGFQIQPPNPALPSIAAVLNAVSTQATIYQGGAVSVYGTNLPATLNAAQATLVPVSGGPSFTLPVLFASSTQVNLQIPGNIPIGPAILTLGNGTGSVSLVVPIALAPPVIVSVVNLSNSFIDTTHSAGPGDLLTIQANGLDPSVTLASGRLQVTVGGVPVQVLSINGSQIQFSLNHAFGGSPEPVVVIVDGSSSTPYTILAR